VGLPEIMSGAHFGERMFIGGNTASLCKFPAPAKSYLAQAFVFDPNPDFASRLSCVENQEKKPGKAGLGNNLWCEVYMCSKIASPNTEQDTCFVPSIKRAKS
jgi:hypothetical protein